MYNRSQNAGRKQKRLQRVAESSRDHNVRQKIKEITKYDNNVIEIIKYDRKQNFTQCILKMSAIADACDTDMLKY